MTEDEAIRMLCRKHYNQLYRNGLILPDKKDYCEVCGDRIGKMVQCGKKYIDYYGITMCRRHYEQVHVYGKITNPEMGWHNIEK